MTTDLEHESFVVSWFTDCKNVMNLASACAVFPQLFSVDALYLYTRANLWTTGKKSLL